MSCLFVSIAWPATMADAWVSGTAASAQHPIGGRGHGHDGVIATFAVFPSRGTTKRS